MMSASTARQPAAIREKRYRRRAPAATSTAATANTSTSVVPRSGSSMISRPAGRMPIATSRKKPADDDPTPRAVDERADARHEHRHEADQHETREWHGGAAPPGVIDAREDPHGAHAEKHPQQLPLHEVEARAVPEVGLGGRGAVGHHQAVHDQQERDENDRAAFGDAGAGHQGSLASRGAGRRRRPPAGARIVVTPHAPAPLGGGALAFRRRRRRAAVAALGGAPFGARATLPRGGILGPVGVVQARLAHAASQWTHDASTPRSSLTSLRKCSPRSTYP